MTDTPEPPTDITITLHNGTVIPCTCRYAGPGHNGCHSWTITTRIPPAYIRSVTATLPARSTITLIGATP